MKAPVAPKRRDENNKILIINTEKDEKIRTHQVSHIPFPFTSVSDYEVNLGSNLQLIDRPGVAGDGDVLQQLVVDSYRILWAALLKALPRVDWLCQDLTQGESHLMGRLCHQRGDPV